MTALLLIFWTIFPFIAIYASKFFVARFSLRKRFHLKPVDIVVPLLLIGMHGATSVGFGESILPYFLISIFLLLISIAMFQAYFYEEIYYPRLFKMFWRTTFLFTMFVYYLFIILSFVNKF
ncbi:MAG: DUF3397 domain-containing protein [Streptococcaceae bacterium]|nr:DUF3397 domain-containing protein [Streptococcaceae bacterium]